MDNMTHPMYRLIALSIVGGVAKALFSPGWPRQVSESVQRVGSAVGSQAADLATDVAKGAGKRVAGS